MTLAELIIDYKKQVFTCAGVNYADKKSVKANNSAALRMIAIVKEIGAKFGNEGIETFAELLDHSADKTNLWAATQLLEHASPNGHIKNKALKIIKETAKGDGAESLGFQVWLEKYRARDNE